MAMLQYGTQGMFVRDIQGLLYQAGLYDGLIDGYFGVKTEDAVRKWQQTIGATVDGRWGPQTTGVSSAFLAELNQIDNVDADKFVAVPYLKGK